MISEFEKQAEEDILKLYRQNLELHRLLKESYAREKAMLLAWRDVLAEFKQEHKTLLLALFNGEEHRVH